MNATIKGVVENGMVRLPEGVVLPEKQSVYVVVPGPADERTFKIPNFRLVNPDDAKLFVHEVTWEDQP